MAIATHFIRRNLSIIDGQLIFLDWPLLENSKNKSVILLNIKVINNIRGMNKCFVNGIIMAVVYYLRAPVI